MRDYILLINYGWGVIHQFGCENIMKMLKKLVNHPKMVVFLVLTLIMLLINVTTGIAPPEGGGPVP